MRDLVIVFPSSSYVITNPHRTGAQRKNKYTSSLTKHLNSASLSSSNPLPTPFLDAVRWTPDGSIEYYADFASKLAGDGWIQDVALIAKTLATESGANVARFTSMVDSRLLSKGIQLNLRQRKVESVVYTVKRIEKVGIAPLYLVDNSAVKLMRKQFRPMANSVQVEKAINLMEILAGFRFKIKDLVDPFDVIKICVDISNPQLTLRYACLLPHTEIYKDAKRMESSGLLKLDAFTYCTITKEPVKQIPIRGSKYRFGKQEIAVKDALVKTPKR